MSDSISTTSPPRTDQVSTLYELLARRAQESPKAPAILAPARPGLSYRHLLAQVDGLAGQLGSLGIGRDDRVAIVLPNGPEMALAFLGVAVGATAAPLNPGYGPDEFSYYLSDLRARALIVPVGSNSPAISIAQGRRIPLLELEYDPAAHGGGVALRGIPRSPLPGPVRARPDDVALVLHTSGTTSRPKMVPLTQQNLTVSACNIRACLELGPGDRCLNVMPLFHIHGLMAAVLASLAGGGSVVCAPGFDAARFGEWLAEFRPTWYTAVPTMHQAVLARAAARPELPVGHSLRFIRSCSSALLPQVMADLERVFQVPVLEAYGMTEASHQMASNPLPPRARKPGSVGLPTGVEIRIMDERGGFLAPGSPGEVVLRGPTITQGYAENQEANVRAFTEGWFHTGDQGHLDEEGYLFLTGRLKEMINRGGEKISPREVDEVLLDHPAVAQALTFAMPDALLGEEVAAIVVAHDRAVTEGDLRRFAASRLAYFKVPRRILFLQEIPKGPTGKPQRIGLAARLGMKSEPESADDSAEWVSPRTETENAIAARWCEILKLPQVSVARRFADLGGTSIQALQLVGQLREALGIDLTLVELSDTPTIADQAVLVDAKRQSRGAPHDQTYPGSEGAP